jgi:hypothetical protein
MEDIGSTTKAGSWHVKEGIKVFLKTWRWFFCLVIISPWKDQAQAAMFCNIKNWINYTEAIICRRRGINWNIRKDNADWNNDKTWLIMSKKRKVIWYITLCSPRKQDGCINDWQIWASSNVKHDSWALKMKRGKVNRTKSQLFVVSLIVKIQKVARIPNTVHTHVVKM